MVFGSSKNGQSPLFIPPVINSRGSFRLTEVIPIPTLKRGTEKLSSQIISATKKRQKDALGPSGTSLDRFGLYTSSCGVACCK